MKINNIRKKTCYYYWGAPHEGCVSWNLNSGLTFQAGSVIIQIETIFGFVCCFHFYRYYYIILK